MEQDIRETICWEEKMAKQKSTMKGWRKLSTVTPRENEPESKENLPMTSKRERKLSSY